MNKPIEGRKWEAQVKGDPNGNSWEISVVRSDNQHGKMSWGWFGEDKLLVSHNGGPCRWPLAAGLGDRMVQIAKDLAISLNHTEKIGLEKRVIELEAEIERLRKLSESVSEFIFKTQEISKITGENEMKAPEEYVAMIGALNQALESKKVKGEG